MSIKRFFIGLILLSVVLAGCTEGGGDTLVSDPFVGGTEGLAISFESDSPPAETYDSNTAPFDVVVRLENKGESLVSKDTVEVQISGVLPSDFSKTDSDLVLNPTDDLPALDLDSTGRVITSPPVFVEFTGFSHKDQITGSSLPYTFRADVCYLYTTTAASKLCIRENILNPVAGGFCEIAESKEVFVSGAPLQVENFQEQARAKDKVGFTFDIVHSGTGLYFEKGSSCDQTTRTAAKRVYLVVDTKVPGLSCTGLQPTADGSAEGFVNVFENRRTVSCTQQLPTLRDFELPVRIEMTYDYLQSIQQNVVVRKSGE